MALALVATAPRLAYDIETTGLELDARICGYAFASETRSVYVPVRHESRNIEKPERFERRLDLAFRERSRRGLKTIGFNIGFDLFHSARHGVWPGAPLEDAQINEVLIYEYHRAYDLSSCLERRGLGGKDDEALIHTLAQQYGGAKTRRVQMKNFWRLPGDGRIAWDYATGDVIGTLALWQAQQDDLAKPDFQGHTLQAVHTLECELIPHLARMRAKGIRVDQGYAEQAVAMLDGQIDQSLQGFPQDFNVARGVAVHDWMTEQGAAVTIPDRRRQAELHLEDAGGFRAGPEAPASSPAS